MVLSFCSHQLLIHSHKTFSTTSPFSQLALQSDHQNKPPEATKHPFKDPIPPSCASSSSFPLYLLSASQQPSHAPPSTNPATTKIHLSLSAPKSTTQPTAAAMRSSSRARFARTPLSVTKAQSTSRGEGRSQVSRMAVANTLQMCWPVRCGGTRIRDVRSSA
jgi:hypothetical protein